MLSYKKRCELFPYPCKSALNISKKKPNICLSFKFYAWSSNSFKSMKLNFILSNQHFLDIIWCVDVKNKILKIKKLYYFDAFPNEKHFEK
jgi:hypothetical protein